MPDERTSRALIDYDRLLRVIETETETLAVAVESGRREAVIPGCPGLTLAETARHVGSLYRMVWHWLRDGMRPGEWQRDPADGQSLADYVRTALPPLVEMLSQHAPDERAPTWWPDDQTFGFWRRRMAHEATVHRCDIQGATGVSTGTAPDDVPEDVALDGIDEVLTLWFEHRLDVLGVSGTRDQVVAVRAGGLEWLARMGIGRTSTRRPGEGPTSDDPDAGNGEYAPHAVVSGSPMQVYLWLWGRRPDRAVRSDGNPDAVAQLWALLRLATR